MIEILAALSASAAGGMRVALPLLVIGLLQAESLWSRVPILSRFHPPVLLGILVSWALFELVAGKSLTGQRVQQVVQLLFSPIAGAILGITVAQITGLTVWITTIIAIVGGTLAFVLQLVQAGWFYRLRGLPLWLVLIQDALCVALVLFAFDAPQHGGLIALLLLWLAIRSSKEWHRWYVEQSTPNNSHKPRHNKQDPD